jgi:hypothetical protein
MSYIDFDDVVGSAELITCGLGGALATPNSLVDGVFNGTGCEYLVGSFAIHYHKLNNIKMC